MARSKTTQERREAAWQKPLRQARAMIQENGTCDTARIVAPRAEGKILAGRGRPGSNVEVVWLEGDRQ